MGKATAQRRDPAAAPAKKRSPAHSEDENSDGDWSPTLRGGRSRGGGAGPLPLRRRLGDAASSRQSNSDEVGWGP